MTPAENLAVARRVRSRHGEVCRVVAGLRGAPVARRRAAGVELAASLLRYAEGDIDRMTIGRPLCAVPGMGTTRAEALLGDLDLGDDTVAMGDRIGPLGLRTRLLVAAALEDWSDAAGGTR